MKIEQTGKNIWRDEDRGRRQLHVAQHLARQHFEIGVLRILDATALHIFQVHITVDLSVPLPGFILKRAMKGGIETATDGLRKQVLKVKKGA